MLGQKHICDRINLAGLYSFNLCILQSMIHPLSLSANTWWHSITQPAYGPRRDSSIITWHASCMPSTLLRREMMNAWTRAKLPSGFLVGLLCFLPPLPSIQYQYSISFYTLGYSHGRARNWQEIRIIGHLKQHWCRNCTADDKVEYKNNDSVTNI